MTGQLAMAVTAEPAPTAEPAGSPPNSGPAALRRVARGGFYGLAGTLVTAAATFGFTAIVTRGLADQRDAGTLFALTSAFMVAAAVIRLGAPTGLIYFLNRYRKTGDRARIPLVWRAAFAPVLVLALTVGTLGILAAPSLSSFLVGRTDSAAVLLTRILSALLIFSAVSDLGQGATRGYGAMRPLVVVARVGRPGLQVTLALAVVAFGAADLVTLGLAWVIPFVPSAAALVVWAKRLHRSRGVASSPLPVDAPVRGHEAPSPESADVTGASLHGDGPISPEPVPANVTGASLHGDGLTSPEHLPTHAPAGTVRRLALRNEQRTFWRFTGPRTVASIAQVAIQRVDIVLLGVLAGPAAAALYTAATRFLAFGQLGGQALNQAIEAKVASLVALGDTAGVKAVYRAATVWLMLLTWPIYLCLLGWAPDLLSIFGPGYAEASDVIVVLSVAMLAGTAVGAVDTMLVMAGRGAWSMWNASAALVVNIVLNIVLIPRFGILGAALAWAAAIAVNNLVPLAQLAIALRLHPFGRQSLIAAALPVGCFVIVPWLIGADGHAAHVAGTALGCVLYAAGLWWFRDALELAAFSAVRRNRAGRRSATSAL